MFTRTKRLLLRPVWPEDWQALFDAINDQNIVCNLASAPWPYTKASAREFSSRAHDPLFPAFFLTLPTQSGSHLVGSCGLGAVEGQAELGYWIAREYWGQGYATEAGRAVIDIAAMLGHTQLMCSHYADNPASQRVIEKLGFVRQGQAPRYSAGRGMAAQSIGYMLELKPLIMRQAA